MAGEWETAPLDDLVDDILDRRGVTPLKLGSDFIASGYRVISAKAIKARRVDLAADEPRFVDLVTYRKWMRSPLVADDVILTSEAPLGEPAYVSHDVEWCLGQRLFGIRTKKSRLHGRFLFYALQSEQIRHDLLSRATGTTAQGIRQTELRRVLVPLPAVNVQRAIAYILGTLDDKIELNRRMNETLEAMARALFKSWFVDFDPVRAKAEGRDPGLPQPLADLFPDSFEDSELGEIPRGWGLSRLGDEVETLLGGTPSRGEASFWGGDIPWINSGKANEFRIVEPSEFITQAGLDSSATKLLPARTTVIAITGATLGQVSITEIATCANQSIVGVLGSPALPSEFIYFWVKENIDRLIASQTGGAQQHINKNNVNELPIVCPRESVVNAYVRTARATFEHIKENCFESRTLGSLRDALLPKLISGELRVEDPARFIGASN